jgi:hypothetical protein
VSFIELPRQSRELSGSCLCWPVAETVECAGQPRSARSQAMPLAVTMAAVVDDFIFVTVSLVENGSICQIVGFTL